MTPLIILTVLTIALSLIIESIRSTIENREFTLESFLFSTLFSILLGGIFYAVCLHYQ